MVAVVADSAANIPPDLAQELGIEIVPLYLQLGGRGYRDGVDLTPSDFYERLARDEEPASTATPSVGDWGAAFERTGQDAIVAVTVAGSMSSSMQHAVMAAEAFGGLVEVVDSRTASMAEGYAALEAARAARSGASIGQAAARAREVAGASRLYATLETFEFLRRSGRVSALQAYAATMLDIKPVFAFVGGEISAVARSRTKRRALARIEEEIVAAAAGGPIRLATIHAARRAEAERLAERIAARTDVLELVVTEVTPVIGAHVGPGLVGAVVVREGPGGATRGERSPGGA